MSLLLKPDDKAMETLLGALVDLNTAAQSIAAHSSVLAELAAGNAPNGVLHSETRLIGSTGTFSLDSRVTAASVAVANLGTAVMTIASTGQGSTSPPGPSAGMFKLRPGQAVCVPMIGSMHTVWGRVGDLVSIVTYKTLQPFAASAVGAAYHPFALTGLAVGNPVTYTTPWGDPAYYGGIAVADTGGAAGTADTSELTVTGTDGTVLDVVNLAGKESTEDSHTNPTASSGPTITVTLTKGAVAGMLRVW